MTKTERVRYEMLLRVRDFGAAHQDRFPESSAGARAFATVAQAVAEIETHAVNKLVLVRESRRVKADRRKFILERMQTMVRTSRGVQSESGARLKVKMPERTGHGGGVATGPGLRPAPHTISRLSTSPELNVSLKWVAECVTSA